MALPPHVEKIKSCFDVDVFVCNSNPNLFVINLNVSQKSKRHSGGSWLFLLLLSSLARLLLSISFYVVLAISPPFSSFSPMSVNSSPLLCVNCVKIVEIKSNCLFCSISTPN